MKMLTLREYLQKHPDSDFTYQVSDHTDHHIEGSDLLFALEEDAPEILDKPVISPPSYDTTPEGGLLTYVHIEDDTSVSLIRWVNDKARQLDVIK